MTNSLAITLIHGEGAADHAEALQTKYNAERVITDIADVQNGDLLLRKDATTGLEWIASNVLLLPGNRAPIVNVVPLEAALGQ